MRAEHTPEPWYYDETWALVKGADGAEICAVHSGHQPDENRYSATIAHANARLIIAAPKLFKAAESMVQAISFPLTNKERVAFDALLAAIADVKKEEL